MIAVITGDIINSRKLPNDWIETLKTTLDSLISAKKVRWEIFRGDSFQVELDAQDALLNAFYIKACLKTLKNADVRIGIGIGAQSTKARKVSQANGEAFINSGNAFDDLKIAKVNLTIKTPWPDFDENMNLSIKLALIAMDSWGQIGAEMVRLALENQDTKQDKIAKISGRSQSSVSEALKRTHYTEIMALENSYRNQIIKLIQK